MSRPWYLLLIALIAVTPQFAQFTGPTEPWKGRAKTAGAVDGQAEAAVAEATRFHTDTPWLSPGTTGAAEPPSQLSPCDFRGGAALARMATKVPDWEPSPSQSEYHSGSSLTPTTPANPLVTIGPIPLANYFKAPLLPYAPELASEDFQPGEVELLTDALKAMEVYILDRKNNGGFDAWDGTHSPESFPKILVASGQSRVPYMIEFSVEAVPLLPGMSSGQRRLRLRAVVKEDPWQFTTHVGRTCEFVPWGNGYFGQGTFRESRNARVYRSEVITYDANGVLLDDGHQANLKSLMNGLEASEFKGPPTEEKSEPSIFSFYPSLWERG